MEGEMRGKGNEQIGALLGVHYSCDGDSEVRGWAPEICTQNISTLLCFLSRPQSPFPNLPTIAMPSSPKVCAGPVGKIRSIELESWG